MSDETPDAERPATDESTEPVDAATESDAAAESPDAESEAPRAERPGVFVPKWLAILIGLVVAVGLVGGAGFWLGRETGDGDRTEAAERTVEPRQGPSAPGVPNLPDLPNPPQTSQGRQLLGVAVEEADNGAAVARVASGSPADDAGLEVGDVITEVDGDSVSSAVDLVAAIRSHDPGDEISITYERDGETTTVQVTLADLSSDGGSAS